MNAMHKKGREKTINASLRILYTRFIVRLHKPEHGESKSCDQKKAAAAAAELCTLRTQIDRRRRCRAAGHGRTGDHVCAGRGATEPGGAEKKHGIR